VLHCPIAEGVNWTGLRRAAKGDVHRAAERYCDERALGIKLRCSSEGFDFPREVIAMDAVKDAGGSRVPLESVLGTEELRRRPSRPPDYQVEKQALLALAQELTSSPGRVLQKLVDVALELCRGHSAGISLLEEDGPPGGLSPGGNHFRWHAVAGQWAPLVWNTTTPRGDGPCGPVLDRNMTLLFSNAHRY
jgi:hypothetical protein